MRIRSYRRAVAVLVAGAATILVLTGCSAWPFNQAGAMAEAPKAGSCWNADADLLFDNIDWQGPPALTCDSDHTTWTYAVMPMKGFAGGSYLGSDHSLRNDVNAAATEQCRQAWRHEFPGFTDREQALLSTWLLPAPSGWKSGERWVRCDLSEMIGGSWAKPTLAHLPDHIRTLLSDVKAHPAAYEQCVNTSPASAPGGVEATKNHAEIVPCSAAHVWRLIWERQFWSASAAYPGAKKISDVTGKACDADARGMSDWQTYPPNADTWKWGDRLTDCWGREG